VDPENNKDGPSNWHYGKDYKGKNNVIKQDSTVHGSDSAKTPAILELKIPKVHLTDSINFKGRI
jgi:hypothetical protein